MGGHGIHGIVDEAVGGVFRLRSGDESAVAIERVGAAGAGEIKGDWLGFFGRPGVGGLPLVEAHGVVLHLGCLVEQGAGLVFEIAIEPGEGEGVVVEARVAEVALADDGVFRGALVSAMTGGRDDGVLLIGDGGAGGRANVVVCGQVGRGADVVPGHHPEAGNVDFHAVVPQAAFVPGGIVGGAEDHAGLAGGRGVGEDAVLRADGGEDVFFREMREGFAPVDRGRVRREVVGLCRGDERLLRHARGEVGLAVVGLQAGAVDPGGEEHLHSAAAEPVALLVVGADAADAGAEAFRNECGEGLVAARGDG